MKKTYDIAKDLDKGQGAEAWFLEMFRRFLIRTDGKRGDFIVRADGEKLELKSEFYVTASPGGQAMEFRTAMSIPNPPDGWSTTPHLAVERYSSLAAESPGGPWQAQTHGAKYYVHFYVGDGKVCAFKTDDMLGFMKASLKENPRRYRGFKCVNPGYITTGYLVPRADVEHLEIDLFPAWKKVGSRASLHLSCFVPQLERRCDLVGIQVPAALFQFLQHHSTVPARLLDPVSD